MLSLDEVPDIDSLDAQIASLYIKRKHLDRWLAFDESVFETLWREGRDIGDVDVLSEIAENAGIDGDEIRDAVADDQLRSSLFEEFTEAQRDGVTGVPTFACEGHARPWGCPSGTVRTPYSGRVVRRNRPAHSQNIAGPTQPAIQY